MTLRELATDRFGDGGLRDVAQERLHGLQVLRVLRGVPPGIRVEKPLEVASGLIELRRGAGPRRHIAELEKSLESRVERLVRRTARDDGEELLGAGLLAPSL